MIKNKFEKNDVVVVKESGIYKSQTGIVKNVTYRKKITGEEIIVYGVELKHKNNATCSGLFFFEENELIKSEPIKKQGFAGINDFTKLIDKAILNAKVILPPPCYCILDDVHVKPTDIDKVYFNEPYTIVKWKDKSITRVKCQKGDNYDKEKGLALCFAKKVLGNNNKWYNVFKHQLGEQK